MLKKYVDKADSVWKGLQCNYLARLNNFDPQKAIIISGDPRGGTTWLAQLVSEMKNTALIWEPLMVSRVKEVAQLGFSWRQYIPEKEQWSEARAAMEKIFRGQLLSPYLCQQTSAERIRKAKYLIVKFCRANQLLPWLTREFAFQFKPIYLVRHPCAVVASQLNHGGWNHLRSSFAIPDGRYKEFYAEHASFLNKIDTVEKGLAATWCLCNRIPLNHPGNNKRWITITYEALLLDGYAQLKRMEKAWGIELPEQVYDKLTKASLTTVSSSPIVAGKVRDQLGYWQAQLSSRQIDDILSVLDYFGIKLYGKALLPEQVFVN